MKRTPGQILTIFILLLLASVSMRAMRAKAYGDYNHCRRNLNEIHVACEFYYFDHNEQYPERLVDLTPKYLKDLPHCPLSSPAADEYGYASTANQFTICCRGGKHLSLCGLEDWPLAGTHIPATLER
jgi:hypothetical protein